MRRLAAAFLLSTVALAEVGLIASSAAAQQTPSAERGQDQPPRFRSGAEVIAIDVTVLDREGMPVGDLTSDDFTVTVEGRPRAIQSTQFLRSEKAPRAPRPDESSNTGTASGRLLLIVTDDATLRTSSKAVVESARGLLEHLGPGDQVGVAHVPDGGGVPFTTDHARVIAELARIRPAPPNVVRADATVYISEALDFDGARRFQWPAAVQRECAAEADTPVYRLCVLNLEHAARMLLIDESARTNATLRALERLMKNLEPTGLPVTLVLIAESMVIARDPAALVGLAEACAAARVSLHVVQPAPAASEMTARGFPSDPVTDAQLRAEGLEQMAARTRGEFHRAVSTGAQMFEQIGREVSGYYLLGIEPEPEDRRQPRRRVDVRVRRPGLTVRARSMFALNRPADLPADAPSRLRRMLEEPVPARGVPVRITTRVVNGDTSHVRVLVAAEIGEATDQQARYHVGLIAIDDQGAVKSRAAATALLSPARKGRQSPSLFTTSLLLEPGDYSLRLAVVDEGGRSGSVHHLVHASMREWSRGVRTSDLIVANQPESGEFPPFNASAIVDTAEVAAVLEVMHEDAAALNQADVRFEMDGTAVAAFAEPAAASGGQHVRSFTSLMTPTANGEHRLRAIVTAPGAGAIAIERVFSYEPGHRDDTEPSVMRAFIEALERRLPVSPALAAFVAQAKRGQFVPAPDAEARPDGDLAMVTFVGGLAALRDGKPALARALFQQTLRKAPGFEGAEFYLSLIP